MTNTTNTIIDHTLQCGARLAIEPMSGAASAAIGFALPGGTTREHAHLQGSATMLCEYLERGCAGLTSRALADALDTLGVARSVSTGPRALSISATLLGENLHKALPIITDMALKPRFDAEHEPAVESLALQSLMGLKDEPASRAFVELSKRHAPEPFNRSNYGTEEGINTITLDDLRELHTRSATPKGAVIGVAGCVQPDEVIEQLETLTSSWHGEANPIEYPAQRPAPAYHYIEDDTDQVQIALCADAPAEPEASSWPTRLAASVLSGGMGSRLFTEVREKRGLVYSVYARYAPAKDHGLLTAYAGTTTERAQETLDVLHEELMKIREPEHLPTQEELDRARIGMLSKLVMRSESTSARASGIAGDIRTVGRPRPLSEITDSLNAVTLEDIHHMLTTTAAPKWSIVTLGKQALTPPA